MKLTLENLKLQALNQLAGSGGTTGLKMIKNTEVTFNYTCKTQFGERLALVGNLALIGHWDVNKAVYLNTTNNTYPVWSIKIDLPRDRNIEYKYLIIKEQPGLSGTQGSSAKKKPLQVTWENLPPNVNRTLNTYGKKEIIVYESIGSQEAIEEYVEAQGTKRFMSCSEMESVESEDPNLNQSHNSHPGSQGVADNTGMPHKEFKQAKRKPIIQEVDEDVGGYRESDESAEADDERSLITNDVKVKYGDPKRRPSGPKYQEDRHLTKASSATQDRKKTLFEQSSCISSMGGGNEPIVLDPIEPRFLVSFYLPFKLTRDQQGKIVLTECFYNPPFLYSAYNELVTKKNYNFKWIGILTSLDQISEQEKEKIENDLNPKGYYPIFVQLSELVIYFNFYENVMRTLFHNFKSLYEDNKEYENEEHWKEYMAINKKFAQKIFDVRNQYVTMKQIWIHGDQLLMVPFFTRRQLPDSNIGFFFHSPFPSSGIFRMFQFRIEILQSLLQADLIGFHLFEYGRNFIMTCHRILGLEYEFSRGGYLGINNHGKNVMIRVSHIGLDEDHFSELINSKKFKQLVKSFQTQIAQLNISNSTAQRRGRCSVQTQPITNKVIISSIDSYHPISGVKNKLLAYQDFLRTYPNYRNKVVLIQYCTPTLEVENESQYNEQFVKHIRILSRMKNEVREIVHEIQKEFGMNSVILQEDQPQLEKRLALWSQTDILLVSSLREGLCLPPFEFVACKNMTNKTDSLMMISEFSGTNRAFSGFIEFNPFNISEFMMKLDQALGMTSKEKEELFKSAQSYVHKNSLTKWADSFLKDLKIAHKPSSVCYYLGDQAVCMDFRVISSKTELKKLNIINCDSEFQQSNKCVIFIDHEALPTIDYAKDAMIPTQQILEDLEEITLDQSRNTVIIFSNQNQNIMEEYFTEVDNLWMSAESGYLYKPGDRSDWKKLISLANKVWLPGVLDIMQTFTNNVDGAVVEERESTLVWNFKNAEEEHGHLVVKELYNSIKQYLGNSPVEIVQGRGYLEVKPMKLKKQKLIKVLFERIAQNTKIDFLLYIGQDSGNEPVYNFLKSKRADTYFAKDHVKYICTVGKKPSYAQYYLDDIEEVQLLMHRLRNSTQKRKKMRSFSDLRNTSPLGVQKGMIKQDNSSHNLLAMYYNKVSEADELDENDDLDLSQPFIDADEIDKLDSKEKLLRNRLSEKSDRSQKDNADVLFKNPNIPGPKPIEEPTSRQAPQFQIKIDSTELRKDGGEHSPRVLKGFEIPHIIEPTNPSVTTLTPPIQESHQPSAYLSIHAMTESHASKEARRSSYGHFEDLMPKSPRRPHHVNTPHVSSLKMHLVPGATGQASVHTSGTSLTSSVKDDAADHIIHKKSQFAGLNDQKKKILEDGDEYQSPQDDKYKGGSFREKSSTKKISN